MRARLKQQRLYQLFRTATTILRRDGLRAFAERLLAWLRGARRYHRAGLTRKAYRRFQLAAEPGAAELVSQRTSASAWEACPAFGIVTAVFNPDIRHLQAAIDSVCEQTYGNWHWYVVDASTNPDCWTILDRAAAQDRRIVLTRLDQNQGISANCNTALHMAADDYIVMFDHDDTLAPFALYAVAGAILAHPEGEFFYSDADKLDEHGERCEPLFKSDWSPAAMCSYNMLNQLSVYRRHWLDRIGYLDPTCDGAQDWDLYLRIVEQTTQVFHIPQILYHWRKTPKSVAQTTENKPYVRAAQQKALHRHLERRGFRDPSIRFDPRHAIHKDHPQVVWKPRRDYHVALIIPSRDHVDLLGRCLNSLFRLTEYSSYEVIVVDTGSTAPQTYEYYAQAAQEPRFRVVACPGPFNFSRACNLGASQAEADLLLFLNNDTEILHADWLERMVQWFDQDKVGIVGAKLLYPDGRLQHAGAIVGLGGLASHLFIGEEQNIGTAFGSDCWYRDLSAVTGACLLIGRDLFRAVGGFDEAYTLVCSDIDLCLKVRARGYRVVYTPDARLIHHEGMTHGARVPHADFERASQQWRPWLESGDPFFNPNLTYRSSLPKLKMEPADLPIQVNADLMARLSHKVTLTLPDDLR